MKNDKTGRLHSQASEDKIFDPWLIMNLDRMETFLKNKDRVKDSISKGIAANNKSIEKWAEIANSKAGGGGTGYHSPFANFGMSVQKSDVSDPVFDTLLTSERYFARRIYRLLMINEAWETMELALAYVDQQILFLKKEEQDFISDVFYQEYNISNYSYKMQVSDSYIYKKKKKMLEKLCSIYDEYVLFLKQESRLKERLENHYKLFWNDFDDISGGPMY